MEGIGVCVQCGFTWGEFLEGQLLGCPQCYEAFAFNLRGVFLGKHGVTTPRKGEPDYLGFWDNFTPDVAPVSPEWIARLQEQLSDAVRMEKYEEAARIKRILNGMDDAPGIG